MTTHRPYRYYDLILAAFVAVLLCSNLIGPGKATLITLPLFGEITFSAAVLFFPVAYVFGDVLTEVYGYGRDRRAVWAGFAALAFASLMAAIAVALPTPADDYNREYQSHMEGIFGNTGRIVLGSIVAFWCGSLANSYIMARMKVRMAGRHLWMRTIGSTLVGQAVDSLLFFVIAFYAVWPTAQLVEIASTEYVMKVGIEALLTPVTYRVVAFLKAREQEDWYDRETNFNPFLMRA